MSPSPDLTRREFVYATLGASGVLVVGIGC
jgi:hypothetical protein